MKKFLKHENVNTFLAISAFTLALLTFAMPNARNLVLSIDYSRAAMEDAVVEQGLHRFTFSSHFNNNGDTPLKINYFDIYLADNQGLSNNELNDAAKSHENDNPACQKPTGQFETIFGQTEIPTMIKSRQSLNYKNQIGIPADGIKRIVCLDISVRDEAGYQHNFLKALGTIAFDKNPPAPAISRKDVNIDDWVVVLNRKNCFNVLKRDFCLIPSFILSDYGN